MRIHRLLEQLLRAGYPTEQPRDEESLFEYALNNNKFYALRLIARRDVDPRLQPGEQAAQRLRLVEERLHKLTERAHYLQLEQKDLDEGAALLRVAGRLMTQTHNPGALDIPPPHRGMQSISILFLAHPTLRNTFKHANAGGEIRRSLFEQEKEPEQRKNLNVILDWLPTAQAADVDNLYGTIAALVEARCSLSAMSAIVFN